MKSVSYIEALPPREQPVMNLFLRSLAETYDKARLQGMDKPDVKAFMDAFQTIYFPKPKTPKRMAEKDYRDRKKAQGICIHCSNPALPGLEICQACREKRHDEYMRRKERLERGGEEGEIQAKID